MENGFYITNLSKKEHVFGSYHFCRGNNSKMKSRIGLVIEGKGEFFHLNRRIPVSQGDIIFVPEKVFCYSEWTGTPAIRVAYINFNMHCNDDCGRYEVQVLPTTTEGTAILRDVLQRLDGDNADLLEAYSRFYHFLSCNLSYMNQHCIQLDKVVYDAIDYMTSHSGEDFHIGDVAAACSTSESTLYHLFQKQLGQTPVSYLNAVKVNRAMQYLERGDLSVSEVCRMVNFHSDHYFRRVFQSITGMTPSDYRKKCRRI